MDRPHRQVPKCITNWKKKKMFPKYPSKKLSIICKAIVRNLTNIYNV